jgi:respiratory burst oxidase
MHRVGQYYFLNFPALSLTEWHPFSVSSGPREEEIEVHIRGLGDHTNRLVEFAKQKEAANETTFVLMDGPYGLSSAFNYRRYCTLSPNSLGALMMCVA